MRSEASGRHLDDRTQFQAPGASWNGGSWQALRVAAHLSRWLSVFVGVGVPLDETLLGAISKVIFDDDDVNADDFRQRVLCVCDMFSSLWSNGFFHAIGVSKCHPNQCGMQAVMCQQSGVLADGRKFKANALEVHGVGRSLSAHVAPVSLGQSVQEACVDEVAEQTAMCLGN